MVRRTVPTLNDLLAAGEKVYTVDGELISEAAALPPTAAPTPAIIVEAPIVNVSPAEVTVIPEIVVQPPDMQPVADAISGLRDTIMESIRPVIIPAPTVNFEPQPAVDFSPMSEAMSAVAAAITDKPDHGEAILKLLSSIANRNQNATWQFKVYRDARGEIEEMTAIKTVTE